jgi:UDP-N-acetylmuramoyl-tripeptide--D-alanyl-D-alanine ligase
MSLLASTILAIGILTFASKRLLRYLLYFQQEGYEPARFYLWFSRVRAFDRRGSLVVACGIAASRLLGGEDLFLCVSAVSLIVVGYFVESDPRVVGKVRLSMTARATKIYQLALGLYALVTIIVLLSLTDEAQSIVKVGALVGLIQIIPLLIPVANLLLWPIEKTIQENFQREAETKLRNLNPVIIGITGSYGKTSTKAILGDLLNQCVGSTHWPRGSINTVMGITRDVRENLRPTHKFSIIEMGAHGVGSIRRLCDFTPPSAAIVTAVGVMHLERFGSEDGIYKAKSELPQALPKNGILVCNGDNPGARRMATEYYTSSTYLYGMDSNAGILDTYGKDITLSASGSSFFIVWRGKEYHVTTPLIGIPAISNALGAFTMACALGGNPSYIAAALSTIQPVKNRLSIEKSRGVTYLQDAFNSNPTGFAAALRVLKESQGKRKILITPGMIELGARQFEDNRSIAESAGSFLNVIIVVGETNKAAFASGLKSSGMSVENIHYVETREEGFNLLRKMEMEGDIVLIENDLPDLYEGDARF